MHKQDQVLQRYFDGESGFEENAAIEKHLAECAVCQTRLDELKTLASVLQSWMLPTGLAELQQPIALSARPAKIPFKIGMFGWISGVAIAILFIMVRAIFLLSDQLNWAARLVSVLKLNSQLEYLTSSLGDLFLFRSFYFSAWGGSGERIILFLTLMLPLLLYVVCVGGVTILFLNWFTITFVRQAKKARR